MIQSFVSCSVLTSASCRDGLENSGDEESIARGKGVLDEQNSQQAQSVMYHATLSIDMGQAVFLSWGSLSACQGRFEAY